MRAEPCPNAREVKKMNRGKIIGYEHKCDVTCMICRGSAKVMDCPDCDGCGLRAGGVKCSTCQCYGKVPEVLVA